MKRFVLFCLLVFSLAAGVFANDHDGWNVRFAGYPLLVLDEI